MMKRFVLKTVSDTARSSSIRLPSVNDELRPLVADYLKAASDLFITPKFGNLQSSDIGIKSGPYDLVTVADKETEAWLAPRLQDLQPGHCIGEEAVAETPELREHAGDGYAWSIDPIDGTNNFVNGVADFCSMVALMWDGVPLQCWIWLPIEQKLYYAAAASGAFCYQDTSAISLQISEPTVDPLCMRGSGNTKGLQEPYKSTVLTRMRTILGRHYIGSAGVLATRIAEGEEDFLMHSRATPWDHAPVDLLCREAGGHAAMVEGGKPFNAGAKGPIMAVSSFAGWQELYRYVWI